MDLSLLIFVHFSYHASSLVTTLKGSNQRPYRPFHGSNLSLDCNVMFARDMLHGHQGFVFLQINLPYLLNSHTYVILHNSGLGDYMASNIRIYSRLSHLFKV